MDSTGNSCYLCGRPNSGAHKEDCKALPIVEWAPNPNYSEGSAIVGTLMDHPRVAIGVYKDLKCWCWYVDLAPYQMTREPLARGMRELGTPQNRNFQQDRAKNDVRLFLDSAEFRMVLTTFPAETMNPGGVS